MDRQSKKNISITLVFMLVLLIGIVFIFVFPNMFTKYKLIKLINNTIENEKLSAYANISLSINDDDYNLEFELNSTKINDKSIINIASNDISLYYYDHKLISDNYRAFSIEFVDEKLSQISISKLISLMDIKNHEDYYDISLDTKEISAYFDSGIDFKKFSFKLYYDEEIEEIYFDISGQYMEDVFSLQLKLDIYDSDYSLPSKLEEMIINNDIEIIGTLDDRTTNLLKGLFELMHEENVLFDIHLNSNSGILNLENDSHFIRLKDDFTVYENSSISIYSYKGKSVNGNNEEINYNIKGYKSDTLFKILHGIMFNSAYRFENNIYTFEIDEYSLTDLLNIFVKNYQIFKIDNGKVIVEMNDKIDKVIFNINGSVLKYLDIEISNDVDITYDINYTIPEEIKNSLLDKE